MTLAERVALLRAEEQSAAAFRERRHMERDAAKRSPGKKREPAGPCRVEGCDGTGSHKGWCVKHYARWRRGDLG